MNTTTIKLKLEEKIQEIKEEADEPSNYFFKNKLEKNDLEWFEKELKNTKIIYYIFYSLAAGGIFYTCFCFIFLKFGITIFPEIRVSNVLTYILILSLLIIYYNRFRFKIEKLKQAIYLLNFKKDLNEE